MLDYSDTAYSNNVNHNYYNHTVLYIYNGKLCRGFKFGDIIIMNFQYSLYKLSTVPSSTFSMFMYGSLFLLMGLQKCTFLEMWLLSTASFSSYLSMIFLCYFSSASYHDLLIQDVHLTTKRVLRREREREKDDSNDCPFSWI